MSKLTPRQRAYATYGVNGYWLSRELGFRLAIAFRSTMTAVCALETSFVGGEP
ncbi:MAG: hypothetical protein IVW56_09435 [Candidatus Binataceae bacterium]|nr:hypothetical protein [Candidatus Binataceae bacterium]